jgi:DNA-binding transcriptional ArsR family regulator
MSNNGLDSWADVLKTLGHPIRLKIVETLLGKEQCVSSIWNMLELPQSTVSQHLSVLRSKGIVEHERCGAKVKYFIKNKKIEELVRLLKKA